ncbi:MAG: hypothetical protein ACOC0A_05545, partial [Planctomycetota bacterium]
MEYVSLFLWLAICLALGTSMHRLFASAQQSGWFKWISAPGIFVRKLAMALAAMFTGATLTNVNLYRVSERDIGFNGDVIGGIPRFIVPVAPLFLCAVVLHAANTMLGEPMDISMTSPELSAVSIDGAADFFENFWNLLSRIVRQVARGEWSHLDFYLFIALALSLALGASTTFAKFKEAVLGSLLLVIAMAVFCSIFGVPQSGGSILNGAHPATNLIESIRNFVFETTQWALVMMLFGII